jgi:CelD/BcsL family acetyltransferase involved in cellulose biosynthesis
VRSITSREIDTATTAAWAGLEQRALEANAYLSPHFVLPEIRHVDSVPDPIILLIEKGATDLVGVGIFQQRPPSRRIPLPHLSAYRTRYSPLSGLLVDRECAESVINAFFDFFCGANARWHGVEFTWRFDDGPLAELLAVVARKRGISWYEASRDQRATLIPAQSGEAYIRDQLAGGRDKDLRRRMRRLRELGEVSWVARTGVDVTDECVERFIELEHLGWKGKQESSLRSRPETEAFFREMIEGFRSDGRVIFTELRIGETVIASTCNLISGNAGFAFKLGWHPDYSKMAPGILNEVEFIRQAPTLCQNLEYLESGAVEGSFMEELWAGRRWLTSGAYATTTLGNQLLYVIQRMRRLKRWLKQRSN